MSMSDERAERFDVRGVNLLKITKAIDIEIVIAEADFCLTDIDRQIAENLGDSAWRRDAERARREIAHKRRLAELKRDAMKANVQAPTDPEVNFRARFYRIAAEKLDRATYNQIFEAAKA